MSRRKYKPEARPRTGKRRLPKGHQSDSESDEIVELATSAEIAGTAEGDRQLAKRCLAGEVAAWEELYGRYHEPLCRAIGGMLGAGGSDLSRVDEIAARVWYAVVRNDGELLDRFDPARHTRLGGFLRGLARIEIMQYFRTEYRRRNQEAACVAHAGGSVGYSDWQVNAMIDDFATTLTAGEQEFLEEHLLGQPESGERRWSDATIWQRGRGHEKEERVFFFGRWGGGGGRGGLVGGGLGEGQRDAGMNGGEGGGREGQRGGELPGGGGRGKG